MAKKTHILVGAHTSAAGGVHKALYHGRDIGASVIQLFTSNQRQWKSKTLSQKEVDLWNQALDETGISHVMSHDSYLINLGSPNEEALNKSRKAFEKEIQRCHLLKIPYLNFHPGAAIKKDAEQECLDTIVESLLSMRSLIDKGSTRMILETTAGQGSNVGYKFEHLAYIIKRVDKKMPIGVCIDTCHSFAAGYDIRDKKAWDHTLKEFDETIGLKYLYAFHVNDSMKPLGSRRDRHASLGKGKLGLECFQILMTHPKTKHLPKYLETPITDKWKDEIQMLKDFATKSNL